jgi:hypothetical protein
MRCLALIIICVSTLAAVELPGGSSALLEATDATGFVRLVDGNGRREYFATVEALVGFMPKPNGTGCVLFIQTEAGVQQTEVKTTREEILKAVKISRPKS